MAGTFWQTSGKRLAATLLATLVCAGVSGQTIRLRNEEIDPGSTAQRQIMAAHIQAAAPLSGLFLVQFTGPVDATRRAELRTAGVELLKYVPDDAFVVRLSKVSPARLAGISFVRWFGPYRPAHKIHPRLAALGHAATNQQDLAVSILVAPGATAAEIDSVRVLLSAVHSESHLRQGTILRGPLPLDRLDALAASSAVLWIENAPKRHLVDEAASKIVGGDDGRVATPTLTEQLGFTGTNVIVCIADTGLDSGNTITMHPDLRGRVSGFLYYGSLTDGSDGYGHGTHCAGIVAGNAATGETDTNTGAFYGLGVASGATLFVQRIFDSDANEVNPFPSDATLATDAVRHKAKIGSNSWGSDVQGDYDTDAAQFDELVRDADPGTAGDQPYVLEFSAGNAGPDPQTLDSPATGKNVIATGASENQTGALAETYDLYADGPDTMADFSSRGPCADGRIKPDLVAPGTWSASAASSAAADEAAIAWSTIDNYYVYMGGTSMSGPHAAGAAAVFVQFYQSTHTNATPSPALVKAALINSADELPGSQLRRGLGADQPGQHRGFQCEHRPALLPISRSECGADQRPGLCAARFCAGFGSAAQGHTGLHGCARLPRRPSRAGQRPGPRSRRPGRHAVSRQPVRRG
jgi:subtilisin family serine protease